MQIELPFSSYPYLRLAAVLAGLLGIMQSLAWIGMSVIGIVSHHCLISFEGVGPNYGNLLRVSINEIYFRGDCRPDGYPNVNFNAIANLNLMTPNDVYIWMWVVAAFSLLWLFASVALITNVKKSNLKYMNVFIYIWVVITFVVCMIDLAMFVLFILDYITIMTRSFDVSLNFATSVNSVLITAQNTSAMMASLALRGYLLWFLNLCLVIFLLTQTFKVYDFNKIGQMPTLQIASANGQTNQAFNNDEFRDHSIFHNQPIQAFNTEPTTPWYNYLTKDIPRVPQNTQYPPPLIRSQSSSTSQLEESFKKRQTLGPAGVEPEVVLRREQVQQELKYRQSLNNGQQSAYQQRPILKSALRNSRYQ